MLINTGHDPTPSKSGLLTTVGYQIGEQQAVYALEGSIAITGALVRLRDNLRLIDEAPEVETPQKRWRTEVSILYRLFQACLLPIGAVMRAVRLLA